MIYLNDILIKIIIILFVHNNICSWNIIKLTELLGYNIVFKYYTVVEFIIK